MRLHLPKALLAAVLAACLAWPAGAFTSTTTTYTSGDTSTTFNGDIWTWKATTPSNSNNTYENVSSANSQYTNYSTKKVHTGNATNISGGPTNFYNYFFNSAETDYLGNTLRFTDDTALYHLRTDYENYAWVGGIIAESETGASTYTLGRTDGTTHFKLDGARDVNMLIKADFKFLTKDVGSVTVQKGGTWSIAKGKSLTFDTGTTTIAANQTVNVSASGDGSGNASLTFSGAVTNNGTLNIGSNVLFSASNTITNTGNINFSSGATINLGSFQPSSTTLNGSDTTGVHTWSASWTLATGGTVTAENGVIYQYKGKSITGCSVSAGVISANGNYFNIASGEEKTYTEATANASINFINVLGRLTGISDSTTNYFIKGNGIIQVSGTLQYHEGTFLDDFTGTMEIGSGGFLKLGNTTNKLGNLTAIKVTGGGQIGGCGTAKPSGVTVELAGGKLTSAGENLTYSGQVKVTADSTIEPETGRSLTISGFVDAQGGVITTNGSVKHTNQWDMSGQGNNYTSSLKIASGTFESAGWLWGTANSTKILLEEGANFKKGNFTFTGKADAASSITFGTTGIYFAVGDSHTVSNTTVTFAGGDGNTVETLGMNMSSSDLVASSGRLNLKTTVNAQSVTVKNGATIELLSDILSEITSDTAPWTWEKGSTLSYGKADKYNYDADLGIDVGQKTVTDSGTTYGTTIELHGFKGGLASTTAEIARDIKLTNNGRAAAEFTDIKGTSYTFTGKVKGDGNLVFNQANHETALSFKGDLSEWTSTVDDQYGGLRVCAGIINATIEGTPKKGSVANAFNADGGTLNLTISRDATLGNRVVVTSLTISEGKSLNLANNGRKVEAGSTVIDTGATVTVDNKSTAENGTVSYGSVKLGTVSGAGALKTVGGTTEIANASGFTGSLEVGANSVATIKNSIKGSTESSITTLKGTGTLKTTGGKTTVASAADFSGALEANGGNIDILGTSTLTVTDLVIGASNTVGVYEGSTAPTTPTTTDEGTLTVTNLTANSGSTLNANLVLDGANLTLNGSLTMGSSLTLNNVNLVNWNTLVGNQTGNSIVLFTSVDELTLGGTTYKATELTEAVQVGAGTVFSNQGASAYNLSFGHDGVVSLMTQDTPEPTTATLSLLALMALAARRRRKA